MSSFSCRTIPVLSLSITSLITPSLFAQDTAGVGTIQGALKDATGAPVQAVRICVQTTARCGESSDVGMFRISEVRAGQYRLEIIVPGKPPFLSSPIEVRAGIEATVEIDLPQIDDVRQSVTVSDSVFVPTEEIKTSGFLIQRYEIFKAAGDLVGVKVFKHPTNSDAYFGRSDNQALADQGVPAHTLSVAYEFPDYHQVGDSWDKIDYENMAKVDRMVAVGLLMIANNPSEPKWNEANPKAARYVKAWHDHHPN